MTPDKNWTALERIAKASSLMYSPKDSTILIRFVRFDSRSARSEHLLPSHSAMPFSSDTFGGLPNNFEGTGLITIE